MKMAGAYLATVVPRLRQSREGLTGLLPQRKVVGRRGRPPTIHARELSGPMPKVTATENEGSEGVRVSGQLDEDETLVEDVGDK